MSGERPMSARTSLSPLQPGNPTLETYPRRRTTVESTATMQMAAIAAAHNVTTGITTA